MYRTIDRYIAKEILQPFVLILFIMTFVLLMGKLLQLMDMMINKGLGIVNIATLIFYLLPSFLIFTLPISFLTSILIGVGRLSADNELIALRAAGIGLLRLLPPVMTLAFLFFCVTAAVSFFLLPYGNKAAKGLLFHLAMTHASVGIKPGVFNTDFRGIVIYAQTVSAGGEYLRDVIISDNRLTGEPGTFYAERAFLLSDPLQQKVFLRLEKGSLHLVDLKRNTYRRLDFASYDVQLDIAPPASGRSLTPQLSFEEMTAYDLWRKMQAAGSDTQSYREAAIELNKRFSIPLSALIFGLLGIPLAVRAHRSVKSRGITISLILVLGYYLLQIGGRALVENGWVPVWVGTWTPNILFLFLGLSLLYLAKNDTSLRQLFRERSGEVK